ncbi:hypothetical protein NG798_09460 [Ancylothrix sp. C2]|uniref:heterocyst-inhibiting protein PatX n=1 Tax=Ancylothrix sp. D3o TaxID=2953691 RepID=UPI0021BA7507|nr:hypothetical protein [Ancylothrix sp. D3o]MCT7950011.1 hypothetical protein [Ancylothrix sp. D3o]
MRTYASILLSSLLIVSLAIESQQVSFGDKPSPKTKGSSLPVQAQENCQPHRGSGRKECAANSLRKSKYISFIR